jgi:propanol-preferring alcohol dehydrogenase
MFAMVLDAPGQPLRPADLPAPTPAPDQVLLRVSACGICRTDLHILDGDLDKPKRPLIPGHQIVGIVAAMGERVTRFKVGDRVGVPWLGWTDGTCPYCRTGHENLCDNARFTGYDINGGYAEQTVADERFCFPIPAGYPDDQAAPLLCAGLIGYRAYTMAGDAKRLGLYGFGNAAHILTQIARHQGREVFAFTRPGDTEGQQSARALGAVWAGGSDGAPPEKLDAAILFAAAGELVPTALRAVDKGGSVICAEIHMSDIPSFPYDILWEERIVRSVANLTRHDGEKFLALAPTIPVRTEVQTFPLAQANEAITAMRRGTLRGTAVLVPHPASGHESD